MAMLDLPSVCICNLSETEPKADGLTGLVLKHRIFDAALADDLAAAVEYLDDNNPSGTLLICSDGEDFSLNKDNEESSCPEKQSGVRRSLGRLEKTLGLLLALPCPTIAKINGRCSGWGLGLVLACDWRWACPDAVFACGEPDLSGLPGFVSWMLPRTAGLNTARRMIFNGESLNAAQAVKAGLADQLSSRSLDEAQLAQAKRFASADRQSWLGSRRLLLGSSASLREDHLGTYLALLAAAENQERCYSGS